MEQNRETGSGSRRTFPPEERPRRRPPETASQRSRASSEGAAALPRAPRRQSPDREPQRRPRRETASRTAERSISSTAPGEIPERSRPARTRPAEQRPVTPVEELTREGSGASTARKTARRQTGQGRDKKKKRRPRRISNTNFKFKFLTMLAVVAVLILGLIIFFKVKTIEVVGNDYYTAEEIIENSGIHLDDNLLSLSKAAVSANIHKDLHYIEEVQIKKKLPGTVTIIVKEAKVTYGIQDRTGGWWLIDKNGKVLDKADAQSVKDHTVVKGLQIQTPELGQQIKPADADGADMAELSAKQTALEQLLPLLEENPLAKSIVSVDLTTSYDIVLWYETKFEIRLGNIERLEDKLQFLRSVVEKMKNENGVWTVDLTFQMGQSVIVSPRN